MINLTWNALEVFQEENRFYVYMVNGVPVLRLQARIESLTAEECLEQFFTRLQKNA